MRKSREAGHRTYGRPRIPADLKAQGERVVPKRIAGLMQEEGIEGASRPRRKAATTGTPTLARRPT